MHWHEFTISSSRLAAEAVMAIAQDIAGGWASQDLPEGLILWLWLPEDERLAERSAALRARLAALPPELLEAGAPTVAERTVAEEDWAEAWKAYWEPTRVGRRLVIKPTWCAWPPADEPGAARPDDLILELDPGMAFGTGAHATTVLCLEALERILDPEPPADKPRPLRVIDLGCGSGILTIAALRLGAAQVLPIDNDPLATTATRENCERNGVHCDPALQAGLESVGGQWDLILANISLPVILATAPRAAELLAPGGIMICAGFYAARIGEVTERLRDEGLQIVECGDREQWGCVVARKA